MHTSYLADQTLRSMRLLMAFTRRPIGILHLQKFRVHSVRSAATPNRFAIVEWIAATVVTVLFLSSGVSALGDEQVSASQVNVPVNLSSEELSKKIEDTLVTTIGVPPTNTIVKWKSDIHVGVISDEAVPAETFGTLTRDLVDAERATNHAVFLFGRGANFVVVFSQNTQRDMTNHENILSQFFVSKSLYQQFFQRYERQKQTCTNLISVGPDSYISAFLLFISVSSDHSPNDISTCLHAGVMTGLGASHALDEGVDQSGEKLSAFDLLALKVLYSSQLIPGSPQGDLTSKIAQVVVSVLKSKDN